jgi:hypothetical protein
VELALVIENKARAQTVLAEIAGIELCKRNEEQNVCAGWDEYQSGAYAAVPANGPAANESQPPSPAATARRLSGVLNSHGVAAQTTGDMERRENVPAPPHSSILT